MDALIDSRFGENIATSRAQNKFGKDINAYYQKKSSFPDADFATFNINGGNVDWDTFRKQTKAPGDDMLALAEKTINWLLEPDRVAYGNSTGVMIQAIIKDLERISPFGMSISHCVWSNDDLAKRFEIFMGLLSAVFSKKMIEKLNLSDLNEEEAQAKTAFMIMDKYKENKNSSEKVNLNLYDQIFIGSTDKEEMLERLNSIKDENGNVDYTKEEINNIQNVDKLLKLVTIDVLQNPDIKLGDLYDEVRKKLRIIRKQREDQSETGTDHVLLLTKHALELADLKGEGALQLMAYKQNLEKVITAVKGYIQPLIDRQKFGEKLKTDITDKLAEAQGYRSSSNTPKSN